MSAKSGIRLFILCTCILVLLCVPVAADYVISDLSGPPIVRGHQFTVDITGNPKTAYYLWLTGTWSLSGGAYDQPPFIIANQWNVQQDPDGGPYTIGSYKYNNGNGRTILNDVAPSSSLLPNTSYYALVTTDDSGQAVVAFGTSVNTALRPYSVRVENPTSVNNNTLIVQRGDTAVTGGSVSIDTIAIRPPRPTVITQQVPSQSTAPPEAETTPVTIVPPAATTTTAAAPLEPAVIILSLCAALWVLRYR
ncbi:hypothetical protein [Methanoregula sp.]|uniref:hypothetical protein n=1 Tax=Methanoregula sp. TaxID=2052170 RepID=UPI002CD4DFB0|nr:hypothetical protein [Methanoregula sp.]HVP96196.1 hypothetical protein [Methanoregula sp.]